MKHHTRRFRSIVIATTACVSLTFTASALATTPLDTLQKRLFAEPETGTIGLVTCNHGDSFALPAKHVSRITVDNATVLKVRAIEDGRILEISCAEAGTSIMTVTHKNVDYSVAVQVPNVTDSSENAHSGTD